MRVKGGLKARRKHKRILKTTKGFRMSKRKLIKSAREAALHAGTYAFAGRKKRKGDMKRLWIVRISEAVKEMGLSYSRFKHALKLQKIELNSKMLANLVVERPEIFKKIVEETKKGK